MSFRKLLFFSFVSLAIFSGLPTDQASAQYSRAYIDSQLIGGVNTAIIWEDSLFRTMKANISKYRCTGNNTPIRRCVRISINEGGSYRDATWVSARNQGSATSIEVPYGTRTVNLQLNSVTFLSSALVSPVGAGGFYNFNDQRVVRSNNAPNDRAPNAIGSPDPNNPALTSSRFRVDSSNSSNGGAVSLSANSVLLKQRSNVTRYWFATPLPFTYTHPSANGFRTSETVRINVQGRDMTQYWGAGAICTHANPQPRNITAWQYDRCPQTELSIDLTITVAPFHDITPSVTVNRGTISPGETVGVTGQTQNTGNAASSGTYYALSTMTYPAGSSPAVPTTVAVTTNNNRGPVDPARPCQYYASTGAENCDQETSSPSTTGTASFPTGTRAFQVRNLTAGDYEVGTRLCYALSVYSYNTATGTNQRWRHSAPRCVIVAKAPVVNVTGGDVIVGKGGVSRIVTQSTQRQVGGVARTFGSWGEYGIVASGEIFSMASGVVRDCHAFLSACWAATATLRYCATPRSCALRRRDCVMLWDATKASWSRLALSTSSSIVLRESLWD